MEAKLDAVMTLLIWVLVLKVIMTFVIVGSLTAIVYFSRRLSEQEIRQTELAIRTADIMQLMKELVKSAVNSGEDTARIVNTVSKQVAENSTITVQAAKEAANAAKVASGKTDDVKDAVAAVPAAVVEEIKKTGDSDHGLSLKVVPSPVTG